MTEILDLALYFILFILIISIICLILLAFMTIFGKKRNYRNPFSKELKAHSSTKDTVEDKNLDISTKDAEASWMNAVMTTSFLTASMKSASERSNADHDSDSSDAAGHGDSFDGGDSPSD